MKLLTTIALASTLALPLFVLADNTNPFAGAFVGIGVGYNSTGIKVTDSETPASNTTVHLNGVAGQVLAGYNYGLDSNWLIGAQASYTYRAAKKTDSENDSSKMNNVYGIDGLLGYTFNQSMMAFVGLGLAIADLKESGPTDNFSETFAGWKASLGAEQALVNSLSLQETISYTGYNSKTPLLSSNQLKPHDYTGMLSLIYTFNA